MYDRNIYLYFALAIVGFLLWNAWQTDYGPKPAVTLPARTAPTYVGTAQKEVPAKVVQNITPDRIIKVQTDNFIVDIDKLGGNIVSLRLPRYPVAYETPHIPEALLNNDLATYYSAQSAIVGKNGFNSSSLLFSSPATSYRLEPNQDSLAVNLTWKGKDLALTKTFYFKKGSYEINIKKTITNLGQQPFVGNLYAQLKRRGITEESSMFGLHTYRGAAISSPQTPYEKISYSKMDKENLDRNIKGGWLAMQQRYFVSALVPNSEQMMRYYSQTNSVGPSDKPKDKIYTIGFETPEFSVPSKQALTLQTRLYSGPERSEYLQKAAPHLDLVIDYGWLWLFSIPIFKLMRLINYFVHNWGVTIILVTVIIKLFFYKLSEMSYRSMARMRNLQPKLLALKEKFGEDRQKLSQATMELYRKEKINPLGGCLPMIVQIPVFIALYYVLIESVELRQAPFVFWIHDLSVKDPYYVLPVLMGLSWVFQQKLNPPPPDPVQAKLMMLFPVVFTILFATFPAGLVLYWIVNNCLSILQQWYIMRKFESEGKKKPLAKKGRLSSTSSR
jgi:YidC/Oxa1 family membrane protein insertase